jgi:AAA+ ATPase superfamily predicted ATPase
MILKNPFSDYGGIVSQNKFVGRKTEIKQIHKRVLGETFGNLAIMGLPRIGKSSLAWNSIIVNKNELIKNNILPIWIPLGELSNLNELFDEVLTNTCEIVNKNEIAVLEELKEIAGELNGQILSNCPHKDINCIIGQLKGFYYNLNYNNLLTTINKHICIYRSIRTAMPELYRTLLQ